METDRWTTARFAQAIYARFGVRYDHESVCGKLFFAPVISTRTLFTPATRFKLIKGEGKLGDYQFNEHVAHHRYCPSCGHSGHTQMGKDRIRW